MDRFEKLFSELIGNEHIKDSFINSIKSDSVSHCYLFEGDAGSGKHTLANIIARCLSDVSFEKKIKDGDAIDVLTIGIEKDKKTISVKQIREMVEKAYFPPAELDYMFVIIENAECLTTEAQNALLKTLEEPPKFMKIFMLCESTNAILPTVLSRATTFHMDLIPSSEIESYIIKNVNKASDLKSSEPEYFDSIIRMANGNVGKALNLLKSKKAGNKDTDLSLDIISSLCMKDKAGFFKSCLSIPAKREDLSRVLDCIELILRDFALTKAFINKNCPVEPLFFSSLEKSNELAKKLTSQAVQGMIFYVTDLHNHIGFNANAKLIITEFANTMWKYTAV